jgi:two-component system phosphate regulon sensor histidine kinase PhoR
MAEDISRLATGPSRIWRERIWPRRGIWAAAVVVLAALAISGNLAWPLALLALAAFSLAILAMPADGAPPEERSAMLAASERSREQAWRQFADALADPCLIIDHRSVVVHRNEAAGLQFPNLRPGEPLAFSLRHPALLKAVEDVRHGGRLQAIEMHQTVPTETWHKVTVSPLAVDLAGTQDGTLVITLQSLTEAKRVEAMRTDFIANASHELRTPLASLVGFIDTLLGPAARDAAARERFLTIMRAQAQRMSKLIDDLLSLSRIEMRQHVRPTGRVDLKLLLSEVAEGLEAQAREAQVALEIAVPEEAVTVTGDRDELYEVFENLVDNAIKYGGDGGKVEIALSPCSRPAYGYMVSVTDYGAGIATEHVPRLTERFYRVDAESSRKKKGTGLGLAIVKHILTRHRGSLTIKSQPGEGTRVEVLLQR